MQKNTILIGTCYTGRTLEGDFSKFLIAFREREFIFSPGLGGFNFSCRIFGDFFPVRGILYIYIYFRGSLKSKNRENKF